MTPLEAVLIGIAIIFLFGSLFVSIFGFPGTVVIFLIALACGFVTGFQAISWQVVLLFFFLSLLAESFEFLLRVNSCFYVGFSVRGVIAGIIGAVLGIILFVPFLMGFGAFVGISFGGFAGVLAVEFLRQMKLKPVFRASAVAILKRIIGTTVRGAVGVTMAIFTVIRLYS